MGRASLRLGALITVVALLTSGCGVLSGGLRGVDLPGGAALGPDPYRLTIEFSDVVDLVPQSLVKVDDVSVGTVTDISVSPTWTAMVSVLVNRDVALPADAQARIRTTSLLGEKFVELWRPQEAPGAVSPPRIADGATIPLARTSRAAEVEEVLGALSLLLNGGGIAQIRTISSELNKALTGNEPEIRALLDDLDHLVGALDDRKTEITRALDEINRLSSTLNDRRDQIKTALDDLAPGLKELEAQRGQLVDMLQALDRLSGVATDVINRSRDDVLADLKLLQPILGKLAESGPDLVNSLELLPTFPFTDGSVDGFAGDYANLYVRADLDLGHVLQNLARSNQPFPGPDGPIPGLPPTAELLGPLLGPIGPSLPKVPLLGDDGLLPLPGLPGSHPPDSDSDPDPDSSEPSPTSTPEPSEGGGILGGLLGGGR
ncbi:MCE family protein [Pseudonocardia alaniniphila]|uniref:MCE family protein n=1 Tax=Pseudonocardia alaniniphila TaxID=75291 RepID=A0ABS9TF19_9PSEU|nr:MCE family protein [Pseudonocardia alaniniphila]MCH6167131.1 MCE family protein [Pseudonocardia alaniniphila]